MSYQEKKLRIAINPHLIDKNEAGRDALFVHGWENVELSLSELAASVSKGIAYTAQLKGKRKSANFLACDVVSVDIDHGMTIEQALVHPLVAAHAGVVYTTVSHTQEAHRFRIVFPTPRTITDAREMRALARSLALRLSGDPAAVDATRISFGNRGAQTSLLNGGLSVELMNELIAQSLNPPVAEKGAGGVLAGARSVLKIKPEETIRLAGGMVLPFSRIPPKAQVHCPFHADEHASAFVVASELGAHGLFCSRCGETYWPAGGGDDVDFFHFDRVVHETKEYFNRHREIGPLGAFFDLPAGIAGLIDCNIDITDREPAPRELSPGLTLIRSPKGTGKTHALKRLVEGARKVLLIGHRRALIRQSCERLDLACYLDDEKFSLGEIEWRLQKYGLCLDSLHRLPQKMFVRGRSGRYDIVILDESEQLLSHILSDTVEQRKGASRQRVFRQLATIVKRAKRVVALDADLGFATFNTLTRMMASALPDPVQGDLFEKNRPAVRVWLNKVKPGLGKTIQVFRSKSHLIADLMNAIADGKRVFVTANSKALINDIAAMIEERLPAVRKIVITADTLSGKEQKVFLECPQAQAINYDVILTSPAVGTGIDITFPDKAKLIDLVFGFCEANITTHLDFDQQLARVRDPGSVRVWINPRRFHYETSVDVVRHELLDQALFNYLLTDQNEPGGTTRYIEEDPLIEMAALIISQRRASTNALREHFIAHKEWQGFAIEYVEPTDEGKASGRELIDMGKRLGHEKYVRRMLAAPPLNGRDFMRVSKAIEGGQTVADDEWWCFQRTKIELFYRRRITADLIAHDARGRWRRRIMLLDAVERAAIRPDSDRDHELLGRRAMFIRRSDEVALTITRLLQFTPVMRGAAWDADTVFDGDALGTFAEFAAANKAAVENQLGIEIRRDLAAKPVSQLKSVLRLIGLDLVKVKTTKIAGRKIYRYRLDGDALQRLKAVLAAREKTAAWRSLAEIHGWQTDESDIDDGFDDAA